jgi:hypothetical protein
MRKKQSLSKICAKSWYLSTATCEQCFSLKGWMLTWWSPRCKIYTSHSCRSSCSKTRYTRRRFKRSLKSTNSRLLSSRSCKLHNKKIMKICWLSSERKLKSNLLRFLARIVRNLGRRSPTTMSWKSKRSKVLRLNLKRCRLKMSSWRNGLKIWKEKLNRFLTRPKLRLIMLKISIKCMPFQKRI